MFEAIIDDPIMKYVFDKARGDVVQKPETSNTPIEMLPVPEAFQDYWDLMDDVQAIMSGREPRPRTKRR